MRARLVVECGDQCVQTATTTVVETAATICAAVGAAALGTVGQPGMGSRLPALGHLDSRLPSRHVAKRRVDAAINLAARPADHARASIYQRL